MQLCGNCGNYNSDESIFCGHCATRLNNNCPACGFGNLWEQKFCGNCGKQLLADEALGHSALSYGQPVEARMPESTASSEARQPIPQPVGMGQPTPQREVSVPAALAVEPPTEPMPPQAKVQPSAAVMPSAAALEPRPELDAYALLSLEFAQWEQLLAQSASPQHLEQARQQCHQLLEEEIRDAGGHINASKKNILFVSFKREASLEHSLKKAIDMCLSWLSEDLRVGADTMKLRIGLDIELANARNPLTSTIERSVGLPGTLTASEAVYQHLGSQYRTEAVGPIAMGNQNLRFYRILAPAGLPDVRAVVTPEFAEGAMPVASSTTEVQMTSEPPPGIVHIPPRPVAAAPPSIQQAVQQAPVETLPSPEAPPPVAYQPMPTSEPMPEPAPEPEGLVGEPAAPVLPQYEPPVLGAYRSPRTANLNYENAIEALSSELSGFLAQGITENKGRVLALCAADGLGKSNIVHLARAKVDPENQRAIWMGGHFYRGFSKAQLPLSYWIELVQNLLSLVFEGQPGREVREQIGKFLGHIYEDNAPPEAAAFLCDFLSVQPLQPLNVESRDYLGRAEAFFAAFFALLASKRPVIVVMEDIMFSDPASQDLWVRLLERSVLNLPVYFVLTQAKNYYASGVLADTLQKMPYKELIVSELQPSEAERFMDDGPVGGRLHEFPPVLVDTLIRQAKGLPLYLEEAMRLLHLREVLALAPDTGKFIISAEYDPAQLTLPDSVLALVQHRCAFLDEQTLYVLRLASVLGEKFAVNMLMALAQMPEEEFNQALTILFNHGFLMPDVVNTGRFRHGLIWQAVYEAIEPELRAQIHQLVSETLEQELGHGVTVNPMWIAYHSEQGALINRAVEYWNLAGIYAAQVGSLMGMNLSMFRALSLLAQSVPALHAEELALRMVETLGMYNLDEDSDLAVSLLEWTYYFRKQEGDPAKLIEPLGFLASAYENQGNIPKALVTLEKALALVDAKTYPVEAGSLQINQMEYLFSLGRLQQARTLMETNIEPVAATHGYTQGGSGFYDAYLQACLLKAQILVAQCDNDALKVIEEGMIAAETGGLDGLRVAFQLTRAQLYLRNGQYEQCDKEADGLLSAIEAMDHTDWLLAQWGLLAMMFHCEMGDWESASQLVLTVISKSEAVRDFHTWIVAQAYAGYISGKMGNLQEARKLIEQAIELSSDYRFASAALLSWRFLADFELGCGNDAVACEIAMKALEIADKPDIQHNYESIQLTLIAARALLRQGQAKAAGKLLEPLWPRTAKTQWPPLIGVCAFEIGQLYKLLAQNVPSDVSRKYLTRSVEFFLKAKGIWLELRHLGQVKKVDEAIPKL